MAFRKAILMIFVWIGCFWISIGQSSVSTRGWNILSDSYDDGMVTISAAAEYKINHLQLSHDLVMDLREIKETKKRALVNKLITNAHTAGIKEVVLWDHALYNLNYYPDQFKTGPKGTIDLDNPKFWDWFKQDYRDMMKLVPGADGLVLTFIETGARAEKQYSAKMRSDDQKLAAVVDAVGSVVCDELGKKLYIRTFAYTDLEYRNTIGCISHIRNDKIILMMKETPHDFFLTHPNDKYAGSINRPTIVEFDTGNEFNGQGIIANTWPDYILKRWSDLIGRPNVIGYVARTDRYNDTRLVGTPNEILLYTLKRYSEDSSVTTAKIYDEFIAINYGPQAIPFLKPAFSLAFDIVTSSMYTLGTNIANHSKMDFDPYKSSYGRHVSGKWIDPPLVTVGHDVNQQFHYWKDIIEHLAPFWLKKPDGPLKEEAPGVIQKNWVTSTEQMNEAFLEYIISEKKFGTAAARNALAYVIEAKPFLSEMAFAQLYQLFYRTLLTARTYEATATVYFGYRVYSRGLPFQTVRLKETIQKSLDSMLEIAAEIDKYPEKVPVGQWNWRNDANTMRKYHQLITETGWKEYGGVVFSMQ